jgi:hypothetical protein
MVVGLHGMLGVYVRRHVGKHIDREHEHVLILNQKIMVEYV